MSPVQVDAPSSGAASRPRISVVVPVYDNESSLRELTSRIAGVLDGDSYEVVLVDDGSHDDSRSVLAELARADPRVRVIELGQNRGQHEAALAGMRRARGDWLVVLDADLQDPPEAIPALLDRAGDGFDAVFAGRRGRYQSAWRMLSSRLYRAALTRLLPLPPGAGMFFVVRAGAAGRLLELKGPPPQVVAMIGAAQLRTASVPVARRSTAARSAYTGRLRLRSALRALRWVQWTRVGTNSNAHHRQGHNELQRRYFESQAKPNMVPRRSRYLDRHVDELIAFAGLREGDRVLEVGCGMGRYTQRLAARGLKVTGIDIAPRLLDRLRAGLQASAEVELVEGDILTPPPELGGPFDAVVGFFVLHHLHDLSACMSSIAGLLRTGGQVAFLEPNAYNPLYYAQIALTPTMSWSGDRGVAQMRPRVLLDAMQVAGLGQPRLERFGLFPPFASERSRGSRLERRVERVSPLGPVLAFQLVGASTA